MGVHVTVPGDIPLLRHNTVRLDPYEAVRTQYPLWQGLSPCSVAVTRLVSGHWTLSTWQLTAIHA